MYKFKDISTLSWMAGFPMIKKVHNGKMIYLIWLLLFATVIIKLNMENFK